VGAKKFGPPASASSQEPNIKISPWNRKILPLSKYSEKVRGLEADAILVPPLCSLKPVVRAHSAGVYCMEVLLIEYYAEMLSRSNNVPKSKHEHFVVTFKSIYL